MTVQVVDLLKNIDIADDHCKGLFAALINIQDLFKRAAVQRIGQRIVLGLMADKLLRLLIFAVDLIVGQRQLLQLGGAHHREDFPALDALAVLHQRLHDQMAGDDADLKHQRDQYSRAKLDLAVDIGKDLLGTVLA